MKRCFWIEKCGDKTNCEKHFSLSKIRGPFCVQFSVTEREEMAFEEDEEDDDDDEFFFYVSRYSSRGVVGVVGVLRER